MDRDHNEVGSEPLARDDRRVLENVRLMSTRTPVYLDDRARQIVEETIRDHGRVKGWDLLAVNVRTNHVHVVVDCKGRVPPERAMEQFKAWATRRLREQGRVGSDQKVWTEHGSTRWINDGRSLAAAVAYVVEGQ